jgi:hypothetical protein
MIDMDPDKTVFPNAWLAGSRRANSIWKFLVYEDIGTLSITPNGIWFRGRKGHSLSAAWSDIDNVEMRKQNAAWALQACLVGIACLITLLNGLTGEGPFLHYVLVALGIAAFFGVFGRSMADRYKVPWIVVTYRDHRSEHHEAWLADGSRVGWGAMDGGTQKIQAAIAARRSASSA